MNIGRILVLAAFAGAIVALFTTEKGKELREDLGDTAEDWASRLSELAEKASCSARDLQKLVAKEVSGLSDNARERIMAILDESVKSGKKMKKAAEEQVA